MYVRSYCIQTRGGFLYLPTIMEGKRVVVVDDFPSGKLRVLIEARPSPTPQMSRNQNPCTWGAVRDNPSRARPPQVFTWLWVDHFTTGLWPRRLAASAASRRAAGKEARGFQLREV